MTLTRLMTEPARGTVEDYQSVLDCVNACFLTARDAGDMAARHPHCLQPTPQHLGRYLLIKDGGRVVSCLLCAEQTVLVDGDELRIAGIGQVATLPAYRGQGLMSVLLNAAIRRMTKEGFALSDLGGDRLRYGRFGWESAGREWQFHITARSAAAAPAAAGFEVRPYTGVSEDLNAIIAIHDAEPRRVQRSREQYAALMRRVGKDVWLATHTGQVAAYAVHQAQRAPAAVFEFGGSLDGLHAIIASLATSSSKPMLVWSPWVHPANALFFELAAQWQAGPTRMLRVIDLAGTLRGFSHQLDARARQLSLRGQHDITLRLAETGAQATLSLRDEQVEVIAAPAAAPTITLPRRALTRLLFGHAPPATVTLLPPGAALLEALLPLDFTIWRNETV